MLIGRVPEKRRRPSDVGFSNAINGIAGDLEQREGFGSGPVCAAPEAPRICLLLHYGPGIWPLSGRGSTSSRRLSAESGLSRNRDCAGFTSTREPPKV